MADSRRAEIARKKAQIEQMRRERKEKELGKTPKKELSTATSVSSETSVTSSTDPDALFRDLGIPLKDEQSSPAKSPATVQQGGGEEPVVAHASPRRKNIQLSIVKVNETSIAPRENVSYSKETQTINLEPMDKDGRRKRSQSSMSKGPWDYYGYGSPKFVHPNLEWDDEFYDDLEEGLYYRWSS